MKRRGFLGGLIGAALVPKETIAKVLAPPVPAEPPAHVTDAVRYSRPAKDAAEICERFARRFRLELSFRENPDTREPEVACFRWNVKKARSGAVVDNTYVPAPAGPRYVSGAWTTGLRRQSPVIITRQLRYQLAKSLQSAGLTEREIARFVR